MSPILGTLAGIGAFYIVYRGVSGAAEWLTGAPELEVSLALAATVGAFVASSLARWLGILGLTVYALHIPLGTALQCALGIATRCAGLSDPAFVLPQIWLIPGIATGVVAWALFRPTVGAAFWLVGAGVLALGALVRYGIVLATNGLLSSSEPGQWSRIAIPVADAFVALAAGIIAGRTIATRSQHPARSGGILAGAVVAVTVLDIVARPASLGADISSMVQVAGGFVVALVITALTARTRLVQPPSRRVEPSR